MEGVRNGERLEMEKKKMKRKKGRKGNWKLVVLNDFGNVSFRFVYTLRVGGGL